MIRKGGKEYYFKRGAQIHNITKLKKASREKREIVNTTMVANANHHNDALLSKSVDSKKHEKNRIKKFETERKKKGCIKEITRFSTSNHTYTNNIEK